MKRADVPYFLAVFAVLTGLLILILGAIFTPNTIRLGPNQTYFWSNLEIITLPPGQYHLYNGSGDEEPAYFQISQEDGAPIQSQYQEPQPGKNQASYMIKNINLSGDWEVSSNSAYIWSDKEVTASAQFDQSSLVFLTFILFVVYIVILLFTYFLFV